MKYLLLSLILLLFSCAKTKKIIPVFIENIIPNISISSPKKNDINNSTNVVFILADDLGFGDIKAYNPKSGIPTKNLDELAKNGLKFTNAHTNSSVCTPTRYGILTGTYAWRTKLKRGVLYGYSPSLIEKNVFTVADLFKENGYKTACIGKWHLGMGMPIKNGSSNNSKNSRVDTGKLIVNSPITHGFDYFYGISASLDMPPYGYIKNNYFTEKLDQIQEKRVFPTYMRAGEKAKNFSPIDSLDHITKEAKKYIAERKEKNEKFFLYFPLTAPHKPVMPHPRFKGKSNVGDYGDFVYQVDWTVGEIVKELKKNKILDNTMIIVTSDNGSFMYNLDNLDKLRTKFSKTVKSYGDDHVKFPQVQGLFSKNHRANYIYRGTKADIWEGGHRVPFIVHWPEGVEDKGRSTDSIICVTDFFATICDILDYQKTTTDGIDSYSFLPLLKNEKIKERPPVIHHSISGMFAIRKGDWKLVLGNGSGGREVPKGKPFSKPYQLFNMKSDPEETHNFIDKHQDIAKSLENNFKIIFNATQ